MMPDTLGLVYFILALEVAKWFGIAAGIILAVAYLYRRLRRYRRAGLKVR